MLVCALLGGFHLAGTSSIPPLAPVGSRVGRVARGVWPVSDWGGGPSFWLGEFAERGLHRPGVPDLPGKSGVGSQHDVGGHWRPFWRTAGPSPTADSRGGGRPIRSLGVFLARPLSDPETTQVSILFQPELPDESRNLQLRIGGSGLNLVDGDFGNGHFLWGGVDLDWRVGETVTVGLREFPPQLEHRSMDGRANNFRHPSRE